MNRKLFAAVFLWLAVLASLCPAAVPDWPEQVEPGSFLKLLAPEGVTDCAWSVKAVDATGNPTEVDFFESRDPHAFIVERKAGVLTIDLQTSAKRGLNKITWLILVGEGPAPNPGPDPTPTPQPAKIFAVLVEETDDRPNYTQEQINAITDTADQEYMAAKGFLYRKVDQNVVEPDGQGGDRVPLSIASFLQRAKPQKLPRLIISDQTGAVVYDDVVTGPVLPILRKYGGE